MHLTGSEFISELAGARSARRSLKSLCPALTLTIHAALRLHSALGGVAVDIGVSDWGNLKAVTRPALILAPGSFLADIRANLAAEGVKDAVARRDTARIFDWVMSLVPLQGVSDEIAFGFVERNGNVCWADVESALKSQPTCPRLLNYWRFECGYRKSTGTCSEPYHIPRCPLPVLPLRKGALNQTAYSMFLFVRDVCDGDLVDWIDGRLESADPGINEPNRAACMRESLLAPVANIFGTGRKLWSMILADLLLGGDPERERWTTTGASFVVIDSLMHNFLHRTGILRRLGFEHAYGSRCYAPNGCAEVTEALARCVDAGEFNPIFPACFPRFVQHAIWRFCAESALDICNGNQIEDRERCENDLCPAFMDCGRVALHAPGPRPVGRQV